MGIFAFVKEAGEKLWDTLTGHEAQAAESLKEHVAKVGLGNPNIQVSVEGDKVIASGEVASQEEKRRSCWRWATSPASPRWKTRSPWPRPLRRRASSL